MADFDGLPLQPLEDASGAIENINPEFSSLETFKASIQLGIDSTAAKSILNMHELSLAEQQGEKLSIEQLNAEYADLPEMFRKPTTRAAADLIRKRHEENQRLAFVVENGPSAFYQKQAIGFTGSLIAHALDPLELAAGVMVGGGLGLIGKNLVAARSASTIGKILTGAGPGGKVTQSLISGTLGNFATEPIVMTSKSQSMEDYTLADAFMGAAGGAVGGVLLGLAAKGIRGTYSFLRHGSRENLALTMKTAIGQALAGNKVDVGPVVENYRDIANKNTAFKYEFSPLVSEEVSTKTFFMAGETPSTSRYLAMGVGDETIHIVDNPNIAHGRAADPTVGKDVVSQVRLREGSRVLDMEARVPDDLVPTLKQSVDAALGEGKFEQMRGDGLSLVDMYDTVAKTKGGLEKLSAINQALKEAGVSALKHTQGDGLPNAPKSNTLAVLNEEALEVLSKEQAVSNFKPDMKKLNQLRDDAINRRQRSGFDPELLKDKSPDPLPEVQELKRAETELLEQIDNSLVAEQMQPLVKELRSQIAEDSFVDRAIALFRACLTRGGK